MMAAHNTGSQHMSGHTYTGNVITNSSVIFGNVGGNAGEADPTGNVYWTITRLTNPFFTGRDDLLTEIEEVVREAVADSVRQEQCRIVILGMGGQGKSEICLQIANRLRQLFWGVFWVDMSTVKTAENDFSNIASKLGVPARTLNDARQGLTNLKHPWLLVLDNADNHEVDYQNFIPAGSSGVVMLTSRNDECSQYATSKSVALAGLTDVEAQRLVMKAAQIPPGQHQRYEHDAHVVSALLASHPLALIQAGSYISRGHCTLAGYPQLYAKYRKRLLAFRPSQAQSRYRDVYATFEASADVLRLSGIEAADDALQVLPILAMLGPNRLPLPLFEAAWEGAQTISRNLADDDDADHLAEWHVSHLLPLIQADEDSWDPFRIFEAIHLLKALSLVSTDVVDGFISVSMHPLTHAWAKDRQHQKQQQESWLKAGCMIAVSIQENSFWRQHARQLRPHLQAITSRPIHDILASGPSLMIVRLLTATGWELERMRDDRTLSTLMQGLFRSLDLDQQVTVPKWLPLYQLFGLSLHNNGLDKQAVSLLEQVVKIQEQTLAEDHPSRLASQHALATAYEANGQVKQAVSLLEQVVKIQEQLAEDHPSRLASQHALATVYQANGQVKQAVSLLEQVVKIKEQTLAEDHPSRLASQHALATAYRANGQVKQAVSLLEQVVKIQEQTLAEDHPNRLASQHTLATAYQANGQVKQAVSLLEQVVKIQEQLVEDHPSRLASQFGLAICFWDLDRRREALEMMKMVVEIRRQVLDESHPDLESSEEWLEVFEDEMGELYNEA